MTTQRIERRHDRPRPQGRRARGDDGSALLEFALVGPLLLLVVVAIINFGLILSFKQDVTRAAVEGARGGAVAVPTLVGQSYKDVATIAATSATQDAVKQMGGSFKTNPCDGVKMKCTYTVDPCVSQTGYQCVTVTVDYDYDKFPLYGNLPFFKPFFPDKVRSVAVARINA